MKKGKMKKKCYMKVQQLLFQLKVLTINRYHFPQKFTSYGLTFSNSSNISHKLVSIYI